ncbi:hypothetical protein CHARACLAT_015958 [Characodon lateralis]|uniref:Uncharacterized protein n=1 Tax=Characodon lateralis TaxID=208331 RepID=A0ABU7DAT9_9TELE|nr:hypothetical protein [Characodon lateralis]
MAFTGLSTKDLLRKIKEEGIDVSEAEAQRFRDNDVDGDTVDCGLTESMIGNLCLQRKGSKVLLQHHPAV